MLTQCPVLQFVTNFLLGFTPLHHCCLATRGTPLTLGMARLLLKRGADPNARNRFGETPLARCVYYANADFIKLLLELGVRLDLSFIPMLGTLNAVLHIYS